MSELVAEALDLAVVGMATVFLFLTALVFLTGLMSKFAAWLGEPEPVMQPGRTPKKAESATSPAQLAAISAAVKKYRETH